MQKFSLICFFVLITSVGLLKGGVLQWASLSWTCLALGLVALHIIRTPSNLITSKFIKSPAIVSLILFQLWALVQIITPISQNLNASVNVLILGLGILCCLFTLNIALQHKNNIWLILIGLITLGLVQSLYGIGILLSGMNKILWMDKTYYLDRPTGTFVNPNHFAAYLTLSLILVVAYVTCKIQHSNTKISKWSWYEHLFSVYTIIIFILLLTVLMTKSIGVLGSISIIVLIASYLLIRTSQIKVVLTWVGLGAAIFCFFLLSIDYAIIERELSGLSHTFERRLALSNAAWGMVSEHWLLGIGGGAFYSVFSKFRNLDIGNTYYNYAHNDYLQLWAEYGLIGITLLAFFVFFALKDNLYILKNSKNTIHRTFGYASLYTTTGLAIHSLVDFSLHIFAYAVTYCCIISVNVFIRLQSEPTYSNSENKNSVYNT